MAAVTENVSTDPAAFGLNPNFGVEILNSRDDPDPFGAMNVSRVIVGGTIAESGISTIGIAESIDIGSLLHRLVTKSSELSGLAFPFDSAESA